MASDFKILIHENNTNLHLKLMGDFDGSSAYELINALKTYSSRVKRVFIHSSGLKTVDPFGKTVFHDHFNEVNKTDKSFVFTGENGNSLNPVISDH